MTRTPPISVCAALCLAMLSPLPIAATPAGASDLVSPKVPALGVCAPDFHMVSSRTYDVRGRVRVLFFWTGAHDQGRARIIWSAGARDAHRTELLIGTDPERAFRRMNRWGYIAETACAEGAEVVG